MLFYDPLTKFYSVSADYKLDVERSLPDVFPGFIYDGYFQSKQVSDTTRPKEAFPSGSHVFARDLDEFYEGYVLAVSTKFTPCYNVKSLDGGNPFAANLLNLSGPDDPFYPADEYRDDPTDRPLPPRIKNNGKVTLIVDNFSCPGRHYLNSESKWEFVQRSSRGTLNFRYLLSDLPSNRKPRVLEGSLEKDWPSDFIPEATAFKVSVRGMRNDVSPSFKQLMNPTYVNHTFWQLLYCEEYEGLINQHTYEKLTHKVYLNKYSHVSIIHTMCVQTIKHDDNGDPNQAKSRIVALGNHEDDIWTKSIIFSPPWQLKWDVGRRRAIVKMRSSAKPLKDDHLVILTNCGF